MTEKITAAEAAEMTGTEAVQTAANLPDEKFESFKRYVRILSKLDHTSNLEAKRLNDTLQARIASGNLSFREAEEILTQIKEALDKEESEDE